MNIFVVVDESLTEAKIMAPDPEEIAPWLCNDVVSNMSNQHIDESIADDMDAVLDEIMTDHGDIQINVPSHFPMAEYDTLSRHIFAIEGPGFD